MPHKPRETPGAALRTAVLAEYELEPQESVLLDAAAGTLDACAELEAQVAVEGTISVDGRPSPALVELRQQRLVLGRLLASLRFPVERDGVLQRRSARGFYGQRSAS
jgi:hypothetical protein